MDFVRRFDILAQMALEGETGMTESLVIGAGVNVSQTPEDFGPQVAEIATSLAQAGFVVSRPALAAAMIEELYRLAADLGGDISPWVAEYRRRCVTLGREVRLLWTEGQERAEALDVDDQLAWWSAGRTALSPPSAAERCPSGGCGAIRNEQI